MKEKLEKVHWMHATAREFKEAFYILIGKFNVINNTWGVQIEKPSYFSAGVAIELFLKCFLVLEDIEFPKNSRGHNLQNLIKVGGTNIINFFGFTDEDINQIYLLNNRYFSHASYGNNDLRYPTKAGPRTSPHPDNLNRIIKNMDKTLIMQINQEHD